MVQLSNSAPVTVAPGAAVPFNVVTKNTNNCTCFNPLTGSVKMVSRGTYQVSFSGNISGATAGTPVQIAIAIGGTALQTGTMISTPAAANDFNNVAKNIYVPNNCCDADRVTVVNTGTTDVTIGAGATLSVRKAMSV